MDKDYWEEYYIRNKVPIKQSLFAEFCLEYINHYNNGILLELGCGNGRDSVYFNKNSKLQIIGIDQCPQEINYLNQTYKNNNLIFKNDNFTKLDAFKEFYQVIYSRFTLHAITEGEENDVLNWCFDKLNKNGILCIEVRSTKDELYGKGKLIAKNTFLTDHARRFIDYKSFLHKLELIGFQIIYSTEDRNLAIYKDENPIVIRAICIK